MKVGINCLHIIPGKLGGLETYMHNLLASIRRFKENGFEFYIFCSRKYSYAFSEYKDAFAIIEIDIDVDRSYKRIMFEQLQFHKVLAFYGIDILHSSGYTAPILMDIETIQTVHDLNYIEIPFIIIRSLGFPRWIIQRILSPICIRRSTCILSVSESVRRSIGKHTGRTDNVIAIPNVLNPHYSAGQPGSRTDEFSARLPKRYILNIASFYPHKNHANLFRAFVRIRERSASDVKLVLAGLKFYTVKDRLRFDELMASCGIANDVVLLTSPLSVEEMITLYTNAEVFVFPSTFEGFGFPIIEAFACGTPVACSSLDVFREIGGDAASYFDPYGPKQIADVVLDLMTDKALRTARISRGEAIIQTGRFTIGHHAADLERVYMSIASRIHEKRCRVVPESQSAE